MTEADKFAMVGEAIHVEEATEETLDARVAEAMKRLRDARDTHRAKQR